MKTRDYWKKYLRETNAVQVEGDLKQATFKSWKSQPQRHFAMFCLNTLTHRLRNLDLVVL